MAKVLRGFPDEAQLASMARRVPAVPCLSMDGPANSAARFAPPLQRRGLAIPTTDLLIAATASLHGVPLLHRDKHLAKAAQVCGVEVYEG